MTRKQKQNKQTNKKLKNASSSLLLLRVLHRLDWCYYHRVTKSTICLGIFQFVMVTHTYIDASSFIFPYKDFEKQMKLCLRRGL